MKMLPVLLIIGGYVAVVAQFGWAGMALAVLHAAGMLLAAK